MGTVVELREGAHALAAQLRKEGNLTLEECRVMLKAVRAHKKALETIEAYLMGGSCRVEEIERRVKELCVPSVRLFVALREVQEWR